MTELGESAIGVIPRGLFQGEMVHKGLTEINEVEVMHERKATMGSVSDGYNAYEYPIIE
ncbi:LOG family protein [Escherichia coli]